MKIALLTDGIFPYVIGGIQKHSYYLAKYLAHNGIFVDLYHALPAAAPRDCLENFTAEECKYIRSIPLEFPYIKYFPGHYLRASYLYSQQVLAHLKNHLDVDFIYVQGFAGWALLNAKRRGLAAPPVAINLHGLEMFQRPPDFKTGLQQRMLCPAARKNLRLADFDFSLGGKLTALIENAGVPAKKVIEIPIGIEANWLADKVSVHGTMRKFVFVGRYERRKGIEELYQVLKELLPQEQFEFHFIGPIPLALHISSHQVKYWGLIKEPAKIQKVLSQCDVLVSPSHSEGMPTVILEAMATGLAIIATDVGAVSETVSSSNGWLIAAGDKSALTGAMVDAIHCDEPSLLCKKANSLDLVREKFTWESVIQQTVHSIQEIVNEKSANSLNDKTYG